MLTRLSCSSAFVLASTLLVTATASAAPGGDRAAADASAIARDEHRTVEVRQLRTSTRKVFARADGTFRATFRPAGLRARASAPRIAQTQAPIALSGWTKVFSGVPFMSFWQGGSDGPDAKVGKCPFPVGCNGINVARSYFQYDHQGLLFDKTIQYAEFDVRNTYSASCSPRPLDLWMTDPVAPATTWNNQPWSSRVFVDNRLTANGYSASCPAAWLTFNVTGPVWSRVAQHANIFTFALAATNESDGVAWKRFSANATLTVTYTTP